MENLGPKRGEREEERGGRKQAESIAMVVVVLIPPGTKNPTSRHPIPTPITYDNNNREFLAIMTLFYHPEGRELRGETNGNFNFNWPQK